MGFYDLSKEERVQRTADIQHEILQDLLQGQQSAILRYFEDEDIYIRKASYLGIGRIYNTKPSLRDAIIKHFNILQHHESELVRQTVVNAAGEIGMFQFEKVVHYFNIALHDTHHKVRNAVIGSVKKMSQKNPTPVLIWAKKYINHPDTEIRREICHGIELRGRTHPQDVLPLLETLQFETQKRVRDTLIHVLGQISYKKGCLATVIAALKRWKDLPLVKEALLEIIDVHSEKRYAKFTTLSQKEVIREIEKGFSTLDFTK